MRFRALLLGAAALLLSHTANAALINEGEFALDTDTGLEWLDPSLTVGVDYNDLPQLSSGWQLATADQFATLGVEYIAPQSGAGTGEILSSVAAASALDLIDALGGGTTGGESTLVVLDGVVGNSVQVYTGQLIAYPSVPYAGWSYSMGSTDNEGAFLVHDVPETSTWLMMLLGFAGLSYAARKRTSRHAY